MASTAHQKLLPLPLLFLGVQQVSIGEDEADVGSLRLIRVQHRLDQTSRVRGQLLRVAGLDKFRVVLNLTQHLLSVFVVEGKAVKEHYEKRHAHA